MLPEDQYLKASGVHALLISDETILESMSHFMGPNTEEQDSECREWGPGIRDRWSAMFGTTA